MSRGVSVLGSSSQSKPLALIIPAGETVEVHDEVSSRAEVSVDAFRAAKVGAKGVALEIIGNLIVAA